MRTLPVCLLSAALISGIGLVNPSLAQQVKNATSVPPSEDGSPGNFGLPSGVSLAIPDSKATSNSIKDALEISDEEWIVIQPRLEKVQSLQTEADNTQGILRSRVGATSTKRSVSLVGFKPSHVAELTRDLVKIIDNQEATPAQLQAKMAELRQARAQAAEELIKARKELAAVVNQRQEAALTLLNILE